MHNRHFQHAEETECAEVSTQIKCDEIGIQISGG